MAAKNPVEIVIQARDQATALLKKAFDDTKKNLTNTKYELSKIEKDWQLYKARTTEAANSAQYLAQQLEYERGKLQALRTQIEQVSDMHRKAATLKGEDAAQTRKLALDATNLRISEAKLQKAIEATSEALKKQTAPKPIVLTAVDRVSDVLNKISGTSRRAMNEVKTNVNIVENSLDALKVAAIGAIAAFGARGAWDWLIKGNIAMEQTQVGFETMLGSAEKAKIFLEDLQDFAEKTPFSFTQLQEASQRMLALGFSAEKILPTLTSVGDAAAALGMGSEGIGRITLALGLAA